MSLRCPSCGAANELRNPGIAVVVCKNCNTTLYREADVLRQGVESIVGEPRSGLHTGAAGKVGDRSVEIIGRARLDHGRGFWDEWFIADDRGGFGWLVEDEKSYTLEARIPSAPDLDPDAPAGTLVHHGEAQWEVRETGMAQCVGVEGQLDRPLELNSVYRFLDLQEVGGQRRMLIEFDEDGEAAAFMGRQIPASAVHFSGSAPPRDAGPEAQSIRCGSCAAPFELPGTPDAIETAVCPFCDTLLELNAAQSRVIGKVGENGKPSFALEIGHKGELLGISWEVIGRVQYVEGRYRSHEYILFAPGEGYLWLEQDDHHWLYSRRAPSGPALASVGGVYWGGEVSWADETFQLANHGESSVDYVDGAFPWRVRLRDVHNYWLLIRPPETFTIEKSGETEIEHFQGSWIHTHEIMTAFNVPLPTPYERHQAEPNPFAKWIGVAGIAAIFAFINIVLGLGGSLAGEHLTTLKVPAGAREATSQIFHVDEDTPTITVRYEAPVDNSWVYLDAELIDAVEELPLAAFGQEVGYYHGPDWSEGSQRVNHTYQAVDPGGYRLVVSAEHDRPVATVIEVSAGERMIRYHVALILFFVAFAGFVGFRYLNFERARFGEEFELDLEDAWDL